MARLARGGRIALAVAFAFAAAAAVTAALAASGAPRRHLNAADQRFARSMRVVRADLPGPGWQLRRPRAGFGGRGCRRPSESDLVLTGNAPEVEFARSGAVAASQASVFATAAQANAAWQRVLRLPVFTCLRGTLRTLFTAPGVKIVVRDTDRLRANSRTLLVAGYRVFFGLRGPQGSFRGRLGYFRITRGRAVSILLLMTLTRPVQPVSITAEKRLLALSVARTRR